jgi:hypothetical protein
MMRREKSIHKKQKNQTLVAKFASVEKNHNLRG